MKIDFGSLNGVGSRRRSREHETVHSPSDGQVAIVFRKRGLFIFSFLVLVLQKKKKGEGNVSFLVTCPLSRSTTPPSPSSMD